MNSLTRGSVAALALGTAVSIDASGGGFVPSAHAQSQDACAIWICLPGGFPMGCAGAHSEFISRIRKGRSPLPNLASCTVGGTTGDYAMGFERFEDCRPGYQARDVEESRDRGDDTGGSRTCVNPASCRAQGRGDEEVCSDAYAAAPRAEPHWIDMVIDGEALPRQYYQMP